MNVSLATGRLAAIPHPVATRRWSHNRATMYCRRTEAVFGVAVTAASADAAFVTRAHAVVERPRRRAASLLRDLFA